MSYPILFGPNGEPGISSGTLNFQEKVFSNPVGNCLLVDNKFIAIGSKLWISNDGKNWQEHNYGGGDYDIAYGNGVYVSVNDRSTYCYISTDAINWTPVLLPGSHNRWLCVIYGNNEFVLIPHDGYNYVLKSPDGQNWVQHIISYVDPEPWTSLGNWPRGCFGNGVFFVTAGKYIFWSEDGVTWNWRETESSMELSKPVFGDGKFVFSGYVWIYAGEQYTKMYSFDPVTEILSESVLFPTEYREFCFAYWESKNLFLAFSLWGAFGYMSRDGLSWTSIEGIENSNYSCICCNSDIFLAFGGSRRSGYTMGELIEKIYFQGLGYGTLVDCTDSIVKQQENGSYEYTFSYPIHGKLYDKIQKGSIVDVEPDETTHNRQRFRIDSISIPVSGLVEIHANHISYDLSGSVVPPFTSNSASGIMAILNTSRINTPYTTPFTFLSTATPPTETKEIKNEGIVSVRSILGGSGSSSVIDAFGGYLQFDNYEVHHVSNLGSDKGVVINYGKNLIDGSQEENISGTFDAVLPFWKGTVDNGETSTEVFVKTDSPIPVSGTSYTKIMSLDCSSEFSSQPSKQALSEYASKYIQENNVGRPEISLTVTYEQLKKSIQNGSTPVEIIIDQISLGDIVHVYFQDAGIDTKARVTELEYNTITEKYESITLGDPVKDLSTRLTDQQNQIIEAPEKAKSIMEREIEYATRKITGNIGGYVKLLSDPAINNGDPYELRILNQDSQGLIPLASEYWAWNFGGLGFTNDAGQTFTTALTNDGHLVLTSATVASLYAGQTVTGVIYSDDYTPDPTPGSPYSGEGMMISLNGAGSIKTKNFAIDSAGNAYFKGDVEISGDEIIGGIIHSTNYVRGSDAHYSQSGTAFDLSDGSLISQKFAIESNGDAYFNGNVYAVNIKNWGGASIADSAYPLDSITTNSFRTINADMTTIVLTAFDPQTGTRDTYATLNISGITDITGESISWYALTHNVNRTAVFG